MRINHINTARSPDKVSINRRKKISAWGFYRISEPQSEKRRKWEGREIFGSGQRAEKAVKHDSDSDTYCGWHTWKSHQSKKGLGEPEMREWIETFPTKALLRSARILRKFKKTWTNLPPLTYQWKTTAKNRFEIIVRSDNPSNSVFKNNECILILMIPTNSHVLILNLFNCWLS